MKKLLACLLLFAFTSACAHEAIPVLDKHIVFLKTLYDKHSRLEDYSDAQFHVTGSKDAYPGIGQDSHFFFKHPQVTSCITTIDRSKSLYAFFTLWELVKERHSDDVPLLEEVTVLAVVFFNNIMTTLKKSHYKDGDDDAQPAPEDVTVEEIIELYNRLSAMTLLNLVELLSDIADTVAEQLHVSPVYHQRLFGWLRMPWWQPVFVVGAFVYHWLYNRDIQGDSSSCGSVVY